MDNFGVPKKVNRHVLKALYYMNDCGFKNSAISDILDRVEFTMRNNIPVRDLPCMVRQSLQNMASLGVIERHGSNFFIRNELPLSAFPKQPNPKIFRRNDRQNEGSKLDPNLKRRRYGSDDSMSGSEIEKLGKRMRSSKPISRKGQSVVLPKVRILRSNFDMNPVLDPNNGGDEENCNEEGEDDRKSDPYVNAVLTPELFSDVSDVEMEEPSKQNDESSEAGTRNEQDPPETSNADPEKEEVLTAEQKPDDKSKEDVTESMDSKLDSKTTEDKN